MWLHATTVTKMAEGGLFHSQKTFTVTHRTLDIEVQCGVSVLIGVNELGTQSWVLAYTIHIHTYTIAF